MMKIYGYCRISTTDQNESRQLDMMAELNIPECRIIVDKKSGKDFARPAKAKLFQKLTVANPESACAVKWTIHIRSNQPKRILPSSNYAYHHPIIL